MPPVIALTPGPAPYTQRRSSATAAVAGVGVGVALIWGSLSALNQFVLGIHAWPDAPQVAAQRLIVADVAPSPTAQQRRATRVLLGDGGLLGSPALQLAGSPPQVLGIVRAGAPAPATAIPLGGATSPDVVRAPSSAVQSDGSGGVSAPVTGVASKTDPDGDGITTATEVKLGTNPNSADSDGDGAPDGWERANGLNPLAKTDGAADSDSDGTTNANEFAQNTDPKQADTPEPAPAAAPPEPATPAADPATPPVTAPADPAAPASEPVIPATDPAAAAPPDPAPAPDPVPSTDPAVAPAPEPEPTPSPAPAEPVKEPETGGVEAPVEAAPGQGIAARAPRSAD